jgi:hypothetical protein
MTRTEFVRAYADMQHERRQKEGTHNAGQAAELHITDRNEAARIWRREKNRLQNLTIDQWQKQLRKVESD